MQHNDSTNFIKKYWQYAAIFVLGLATYFIVSFFL